MAEDLDVEEMLEAPYRKEDQNDISRSQKKGSRHSDDKTRSRSKSKDRKDRNRSKERKARSRSRDRRDRSRSKDRKDRSRSKDRKDRSRSRDRKDRSKDMKDRSRSRDRKDRSRSRDRKDRSRSRDRKDRSRSRDRKDRSSHRRKDSDKKGEPERYRDKERMREKNEKSRDGRTERDNRRSRSREKEREHLPPAIRSRDRGGFERSDRGFDRGGRGGGPRDRHSGRFSPAARPALDAGPEMTPEERDARTVVCMQLSAKIRPRDLEEFFATVGKVRDVRLITDNKTRKSKGIAYIEFVDVTSVQLALNLSGQKLLGVPILVTVSHAEKNRAAGAGALSAMRGQMSGPMRLYVGSLHFNITEDMLRGIFEPFGKIDHINLVLDPETSRSKGYGFVTYHSGEDALKAMQQLNGFELAGRPMKVGNVTERTGDMGGSTLDSDEMDRAGFDLGATGRLQLMAKLAEGTGFQLPTAAQNALQIQQQTTGALGAPPIATQCFMLSNMFDPSTETNPNFDAEIRDDVIEECNKHGGILHIYVDNASPQGNVYVKCPSIASAVSSVQALHGRWFAGKMITAAYVPLPNYHQLFAEAQRASQLLMPSARIVPGGFSSTSQFINMGGIVP